MMNRLLAWLFLLGTLFSCTLQKRHYRPGFAVFRSGETRKADRVILHKISRSFSFPTGACPDPVTESADRKEVPMKKNEIAFRKVTSRAALSMRNFPGRAGLVPKLKAHSFTVAEPTNRVAKAGFRMLLYSLLFFGSALFCFFNYSALVYITAGLLIIAFVFCLVSLISSASARKDKIANSKGWLIMALITLLLDILEIVAIAIFFIALF